MRSWVKRSGKFLAKSVGADRFVKDQIDRYAEKVIRQRAAAVIDAELKRQSTKKAQKPRTYGEQALENTLPYS